MRNLSNEKVTLTFYYETKNIQYRPPLLPLKTAWVDYKKEILKINYETSAKLSDSLRLSTINDSTYQLIIPPESTVELTPVIPTDYSDSYYHFRNVIIVFNQEGEKNCVNTMDVFNKRNPFEEAGQWNLKNLVYFDYKGKRKENNYK